MLRFIDNIRDRFKKREIKKAVNSYLKNDNDERLIRLMEKGSYNRKLVSDSFKLPNVSNEPQENAKFETEGNAELDIQKYEKLIKSYTTNIVNKYINNGEGEENVLALEKYLNNKGGNIGKAIRLALDDIEKNIGKGDPLKGAINERYIQIKEKLGLHRIGAFEDTPIAFTAGEHEHKNSRTIFHAALNKQSKPVRHVLAIGTSDIHHSQQSVEAYVNAMKEIPKKADLNSVKSNLTSGMEMMVEPDFNDYLPDNAKIVNVVGRFVTFQAEGEDRFYHQFRLLNRQTPDGMSDEELGYYKSIVNDCEESNSLLVSHCKGGTGRTGLFNKIALGALKNNVEPFNELNNKYQAYRKDNGWGAGQEGTIIDGYTTQQSDAKELFERIRETSNSQIPFNNLSNDNFVEKFSTVHMSLRAEKEKTNTKYAGKIKDSIDSDKSFMQALNDFKNEKEGANDSFQKGDVSFDLLEWTKYEMYVFMSDELSKAGKERDEEKISEIKQDFDSVKNAKNIGELKSTEAWRERYGHEAINNNFSSKIDSFYNDTFKVNYQQTIEGKVNKLINSSNEDSILSRIQKNRENSDANPFPGRELVLLNQLLDEIGVKDYLNDSYERLYKNMIKPISKELSKYDKNHKDHQSAKDFLRDFKNMVQKRKLPNTIESSNSVEKKTDEGKKWTTANRDTHDKNNGIKMQTMFGLHREKATETSHSKSTTIQNPSENVSNNQKKKLK